jgi:ribosomal protein L17
VVASQLYFGFTYLSWSNSDIKLRDENAASNTGSRTSKKEEFVVDILSIGSKSRMDYIESQQKTFASHPTVRNFFYATEQVDADPECSTKLTDVGVLGISNYCHKKSWPSNQTLMDGITGHFMTPDFIFKKENPVGWLCAQGRPIHGLFKVQAHYKETGQRLPDVLVLMDDDSLYNMDLLEQRFSIRPAGQTLAVAGCRVDFGIINKATKERTEFSYYHGGFGLAMSRQTLELLMNPIDCSFPQSKEVCRLLEQNRIGEYDEFSNGMSMIDLIQEYVANSKFTARGKWTHGYCMHSDVMVSYMFDLLSNVYPEARLQKLRQCWNTKESCNGAAAACHYVTPEIMKRVTEQQREKMRNTRVLRNVARQGDNAKMAIIELV